MFAALRAAHIAPMVTLYHFTLPTWIAARGGWEWAGTPAALAAFAGRAGAAFGDLVDWWCTINEPNVLVAKSYLAGQWPPGVRDPARGARVMAALMRAHGLMPSALRAGGPRRRRRRRTRDADRDRPEPADLRPGVGQPAGRAGGGHRRRVLRRVVPGRRDAGARAGRAAGRGRHRRALPRAGRQLRLPGHQLLHARPHRGAALGQRRRTGRGRPTIARTATSAGRSTPRGSTGCWSAMPTAAGRCW